VACVDFDAFKTSDQPIAMDLIESFERRGKNREYLAAVRIEEGSTCKAEAE
jgi:hypothetical protein